ncbi:DEAD/DEAH box helicase [Candidatus Woesearchaeota archaeon]|nr:DEAD/DEAH box helicase [Candidatus Woesearchaeota archaeon]
MSHSSYLRIPSAGKTPMNATATPTGSAPQGITRKEVPDTDETILSSLNPIVKKWFFSRFLSLSLPQKFGVYSIHCRNNILISAPTGATKTLTGFLSILNELADLALSDSLEERTYCIYISPLKALNYDIEHNLKTPLAEIEALAGRTLGIRVAVRTGDTTEKERAGMLKQAPHILITTPESLGILLQSISFRQHLARVEWAIIDEIHALAENKRGVHLSLALEMLQQLSPGLCRIGLSATVAPLDDIAQFLVGMDRECAVADVQFLKELDLQVLSPVPNLIDTTHEFMHEKMYELIDKLIQEHKTTLIFTNTRAATERIVHHLKERFPHNYTDLLLEEDERDFAGRDLAGRDFAERDFTIGTAALQPQTQQQKKQQPENVPMPAVQTAAQTKRVTAIGAHHGSLSKTHRHTIESRLRKGELKCVVCSTSLELGIDIGYIDLVILLGSPKSVARALQRVGRSGHQLHSVTKGRIIVLDRDDLIECSVLLKSAIEKKIDRIHIPSNCLDVLAQQIYGMCIIQKYQLAEMFCLIRKSYCYRSLAHEDFLEVIKYLAGEFASLENRHIYAKIWYDAETGAVGRKGKLARVIYMTNIGTIPDQTGITVKVGAQPIGTLDEIFLERLKRGDVFVLGGNTYEFLFSRGMVAQVTAAVGRKPTVPSWFSEMLPLSFDLAIEIGRFRRYMEEKFEAGMGRQDILAFIHDYLYVDENAAQAICDYLYEQYEYCAIPHHKKILIENYLGEDKKYIIFHTIYGRRVNDCLSRAVAFAVSKTQHRDVEIGVTDNGFYLASKKHIPASRVFHMLESARFGELLNIAIDKTQVLQRRFRHCAGRALMILRNYKGERKHVGRQQVSSMILLSAVKRISKDFPILKEARREVLEDLMDITHAKEIIEQVEQNRIEVKNIDTAIPSPFAFNIVLQGHLDLLRIEDRLEFLKRMHNLVVAKISLDRGKQL